MRLFHNQLEVPYQYMYQVKIVFLLIFFISNCDKSVCQIYNMFLF